jgi:hypothetical protein
MKSVKILAALLLTTFVFAQANATTTKTHELGILGDGDSGFITNGFVGPDTFSDIVNFSLSGASSTISGFFVSPGVFGLTYDLLFEGASLFSGSFNAGSYSFADLAPGNYQVLLNGSNRRVGSYLASYNVTAVPEPETWLMIVVGLGLVGFQLHRKQKSLRQQPLLAA